MEDDLPHTVGGGRGISGVWWKDPVTVSTVTRNVRVTLVLLGSVSRSELGERLGVPPLVAYKRSSGVLLNSTPCG